MIDTKPYRKTILQFFHFTDWNYERSISKVEVDKYAGDKTVVSITTHMPGMLIGRAGVYIKELEEFLISELKADIKIKIIEEKMWHNIY